ncbi:MAG: argininosuccinate synthase [Gemmataceae bacterium]
MARTIFAFNGDLESRLALHWLANELGHQVIALSINLGQEEHLQSLGELALELGAIAAQVVDGREMFVNQFALPLLQAGGVYQQSCYLGSALARYVIAQEMVQLAKEEGCTTVAHSAAGKGNDQVRMETAIAALDPDLTVLAPVRKWNLQSLEHKIEYAQRHRIPIKEVASSIVTKDRNLWGVSHYLHGLTDAWTVPPDDFFVLTQAPEQAPDEPTMLTFRFESGVPTHLNEQEYDLISLIRELTRVGGLHGVGRCDVVEDRLFGIKSREFYEAPAPFILHMAYRELESLVQSRELRQFKEVLSRRYAEMAYIGLWFNDLRRALDGFFQTTQSHVTGEVRIKLSKGLATAVGRRSPFSLYDSRLANQSNLDMFDNQWAQGFTSLWTLSSRMAARNQRAAEGESEEL